ncbi:MAG: hypothetical protein FGM18_04625 [Burkholderiaceae bacterium]|nr:hypothetical protein [Burkholderiaceae bacterium]
MGISRATSLSIAALLYAGGLSLITLSPLTDWRFIPEPPWEFLSQPWPRYWTGFDVLVNVLAYIPLGLLAGRAISYQLRGSVWGPLQSFVIAIALGLLLSVILEGLQTYLPTRRPSVLDVMANTGGTLLGAFIASAYSQSLARMQITEARPIELGGLLLFGLWLTAQAAPQQIWLALGDIGLHPEFRLGFTWLVGGPLPTPGVAEEVFAAQRILAEALCVGAAMTSCALILHLTMLESPRWFANYRPEHWSRTIISVVVITLVARAAWVAALSPSAPAAWLNAGTQAGVVLTLLTAYGLAGARLSQQRLSALCGLAVTLMLSNTLPENGYVAANAMDWSRGRWLNLQLLANLAATIWPFLAMAWLMVALPRRSIRALERAYEGDASRHRPENRAI